MNHKSGFVNIIGNPNVGKSTLLNILVGERLSIITNKAQTTRHRILGIVNHENHQIVFSDTPGIIKPAYQLQESMMDFVKTAFEDADILLYMIEIGEKELKDEKLFMRIKESKITVILMINKRDKATQEQLENQTTFLKQTLPNATIIPISAKENFNIDVVLNTILELLPISEPYFPKDALTDKSERFFVNEVIREKILINYDKEIPYSVEVETEEFKEEENIIKIKSVIMVERDSQTGIIIGHKGNALKKVSTEARLELDKKIFLEIFVKINKDWRNNPYQLKRFGYKEK